MAKNLAKQYTYTPGGAGVGTVRVPGRYDLNQILLITNVTRNIVIYNFADAAFSGTTVTFTSGNDATNFPTIDQRVDGYTTITLATSTVGQNSADKLQILFEEKEVVFRPYQFGTDAIERMRVSNPVSLIDADFEYGLQPTKWAGYGLMRGYPSIYEFPGVDLTVTAITTDFNIASVSSSLITVTFATAHGLSVNQAVNVTGLDKAISGFSRADGSFIINSVPNTTQIRYFALGIVGTANGQSLLTDDTLVKRAAFYTGANIQVTSVTSNGANPSTITVNCTSVHGLVPGTPIYMSVVTGTNVDRATGPFYVNQVTSTTAFTYTARSGAAVTSPSGATLYPLTSQSIIQRPFDGGVILATKNPTYGATVTRQSKKYFRYQSGKGLLWSTGTLFKPNYDLQSMSATSTSIGATITARTDDIDHGLQIGAQIIIQGVATSGYNGTYTVASIVDDYTLTFLATSALGATTANLGLEPKIIVNSWHGGIVRAGMFDEQNGMFWEFNGTTLAVVRRTSTQQITGTITVTANSNTITGTNTRFTEQLRVGDKIVIRGMTHYVTLIISNTVMYVTSDYRGSTSAGVKASLVKETRIPQSQFNIDRIDGTGPSGFNVDLSKMHMMGIQYTWYGAGFIDFMIRGSDGNWVYVHRIKNNNVNFEAHMRTGNLPVRYGIDNEGANSSLTATMTNIQTTVPLADLSYFPNSGIVYIDNELISYTGRSATTGPGNLTGCIRAATMSQYVGGTVRPFTAGVAAIHASGVGVILVSGTASPTLSHWGSAVIMDGGYDSDRGYLFNYQRINMSLNTTNQTAFVIRLAPSVENSQVGALGNKDLLNRSQLLLQSIGATLSAGTNPGAVIVEGILNPKNFSSAVWSALNLESAGGQPSYAQVATSISWTSGTSAIAGEQVFAFAGPSVTSGATGERLDLSGLKELTNSPLGGDGMYPNGPDILAINIRLTNGTGAGHVLLRWGEAQA